MLWDNLSASVENDYIDFKQEWYTNDKLGDVDMIHDILCMSNSLTDSFDRYIVIGIEEDKSTKEKIIHDVSADNNCRQSANVIQALRNYMSVIPNIELIREQTDSGYIDIIKIMPVARELPYVLNKECQAQKPDGKKVTVRKEWIYSRNSDRNTPKDECCTKAELEELFARKRGEHLPILERFSMYLDDIKNWKRPRRYENEEISEDAYYYARNHKFKIVIPQLYYDKLVNIEKANNYAQLLAETALCKEYWDYRNRPNHSCYDDYYYLFNVELWADNTLIAIYSLMHIFIKYYFSDNHITKKQTFYLPTIEDLERVYNLKSKEEIEKSFVWKLCKLLFSSELTDDSYFSTNDASIILEALNYDYLQNYWGYIKENKDWLYQPVIQRNSD